VVTKKRRGKTEKVSVSIDRADLAVLRARAKRLYEGNLSAVIAEGAERIREEEGRKALLAWMWDGKSPPTTEERAAALAELLGEPKPRRRRRAA